MRVRIAGALTLAVAFAISHQIAPDQIASWLFWRHRYGESPLDATALEGMWQRSQLLAVGFLLTFAALSLVPHKRSWTTAYGARTLYAYLLHGYVILLLQYQFGLFDRLLDEGLPAVIACTIGAVIVANLLMTPVVRWIFRPIFEPKLDWLFWPDSHDKPESESRPAPQPQDGVEAPAAEGRHPRGRRRVSATIQTNEGPRHWRGPSCRARSSDHSYDVKSKSSSWTGAASGEPKP